MVINQFVSSITFKVLVGTVLAAAAIISFFYFSQNLHIYLAKSENGELLQLGCFSFLFVGATSGLFFIMRNQGSKPELRQTDNAIVALLSLDFKALGLKFIEGVLIGLTAKKDKNK